MGLLALSGLIMTTALLVTLCRVVPARIVLGYATSIDVIFTVGILTLYAGTYSGMLAATIAGLALAVVLTVGRKAIGYTYFTVRFEGWKPRLVPVYVPGILDLAAKEMRNAYRRATEVSREHADRVRSVQAFGQGRIVERDRLEQEASGFCYRPASSGFAWRAGLPR